MSIGAQRVTAILAQSVLIVRVIGAPRRTRQYPGDEREPVHHPSPAIIASAFSSQYVMPISRYILVAVARCTWVWSR